MVFYPTYPDIDKSGFKKCDWKEFCGDLEEDIPLNELKLLGKVVHV